MKKEKSSPKDFSPDDLPSTRWQEYWDFFKTRPGMFFALGGTMLLFFVPFLIAFLLKYYAVLSTAASQLSEEDFLSFSLTNTFVFDAVYAVCFLIFFLGLAGNARIIRQWAWGEGIYFWHDFGLGVKQNGKNYVLASLLFLAGPFAAGRDWDLRWKRGLPLPPAGARLAAFARPSHDAIFLEHL